MCIRDRSRDARGRYLPGAGLAALAGRFTPRLRAVAGPHLLRLALATDKTSFLAVRHGDEAVTIEVAVSYTHLDVYKRQP